MYVRQVVQEKLKPRHELAEIIGRFEDEFERKYSPNSYVKRTLSALLLAFGINVPKVKEKKNWKDICREHLNYNPDICPQCGKGRMVTIEMFPAGRPPPVVSSALFESFVKF